MNRHLSFIVSLSGHWVASAEVAAVLLEISTPAQQLSMAGESQHDACASHRNGAGCLPGLAFSRHHMG